jgi:hypothetical protein
MVPLIVNFFWAKENRLVSKSTVKKDPVFTKIGLKIK